MRQSYFSAINFPLDRNAYKAIVKTEEGPNMTYSEATKVLMETQILGSEDF